MIDYNRLMVKSLLEVESAVMIEVPHQLKNGNCIVP